MCEVPERRYMPAGTPAASPASSGDLEAPAPTELDVHAVLHSLRVHQEELRLQNEELQLARGELAASLRRYVDLYQLAPVGLVTLDSQGIVREINRRGCDLLAEGRQAIVGRAIFGLLTPDSGASLGLAFQNLEAGPRPCVLEVDVAGPDRPTLSIELQAHPGDPHSALAALTDVTDRRRAEQQLARTREILELSNQVARIGVWEWSVGDGTVTWSTVAREIHGHASTTPLALDQALAFATGEGEGESRQRLRQALDAAVSQGKAFDLELSIRTPQGKPLWIRQIGTPDLVDGRCTQVHGTVQDITDRVVAEAMRLENAKAETANRAKSAFIARMSHELRTPLNAVLGFAQLLEMDPAVRASPDMWRKVGFIHQAGEHLLDMVNDVLEFARTEEGTMRVAHEPVRLRRVLSQSLEMLERQAAAKGVALALTGTVPDVAVSGDAIRLRQVLMNLLSNAVKYNRAGGRVDVQACADGQRVIVSVEDTGPGLSEDQQAELFQPFNRLGAEHSHIDGTGLGLVIARQLLEAMGGSLSVQSTVGQGSTFSIDLPQAHTGDGDVGSADSRPETPTLPREGRWRVLCIEDNPVNAELVRLAMKELPQVSLDIVADGTLGLAAIERLRPDLVLMDMRLPGIDGLQVMARLRADPRLAGIRCVAVSANAMPSDIRAALDAGFVDYLVKPVSIDHLIAVVRLACATQDQPR